VVFNFFVERIPLLTIAPRPITGMAIQPRPVKPAPHPAQRIAQAAILSRATAPVTTPDPDLEPEDGPSRADILLEAIVITARKQQTPATKGALSSASGPLYPPENSCSALGQFFSVDIPSVLSTQAIPLVFPQYLPGRP
jgi:hypothetical protein